MNTLAIGIAMAVVVIGVVIYWWRRPVSWQDSEGTFDDKTNKYLDADTGSFAWFFRHHTDEGRFVGFLLNLRDWWENERRTWRRPK